MENKKILIIEDTEREAEFAKELAESRGLETKLVGEFGSALNAINEFRPNYVLTDLFFPAGNIDIARYQYEILPHYKKAFSEQERKKIILSENSPIVQTLENITKILGFSSLQETYEKFVEPMNMGNEEVLSVARDGVRGFRFSDIYLRREREYADAIEKIKSGEEIPFGYFITKELKNKNIPSAIVTSINHHAASFSPIEHILPVTYFSQLIDGHKDWNSGLNYLLGGKNE